MKLNGLSRQIALSMVKISLGISALTTITSWLFYYIIFSYLPEQYSCESISIWPDFSDWLLIAFTTLMGLVLSIVVAVKLSGRILVPLNSVANGIRSVAHGDLNARAICNDQSLGEAASLVNDFNALVDKLQKTTEEQRFWHAAIAHELRTPVTILRGRLQGLSEGVFAPSEATFSGLLKQIENIGRLIEDLRVVSLAECGHLHFEMRGVALAAEVQSVVNLYKPIFLESGHQIHLDVQADIVYCDPARIRQALVAILENVKVHANPGEICIKLVVENDWCALRIKDAGPGIEPEAIPLIFKAFFKSTTSNSPKSTGLGLAVVDAIMKAHNGLATCESVLGQWTQFELGWPNRPQDDLRA
ncbi:sensor histidine kinase [Uliginosibacterium gangwonense]|uniref:sensor histidine kinase n=1 Tax=Uliginosibacterium gangwonense TaxID=392736 RepID=UPI00037ADCE4|nr:HAMP domain-containing sensor histidine kinase [Uliginosibacterium gangwonense]